MRWISTCDADVSQKAGVRLDSIKKAPSKPEEFRIFTSTLSGALFLGLYIGWASLFFF